ncbi:MAG: ATP-binding protein [Clostridium sp.]|nr:ATP-binding protein [Bacteroides sp.]MCM1198681.1 ATP-binding protein [Clostridium sp.]
MKRSIYSQLLAWKTSPRRKPMMLYGARQVGKTYILKEFGRNEFENMVYINCYRNPDVETLFGQDKDVKRILLGLTALSGQEIKEGKTLVFLDEVQDIPDVVASLKYFCEDAPGIFVVAAGSLLGVLNMEGKSFPTGKVDIIHMYPMTFEEFATALGEDKMVSLLNEPHQEELVNALLPKYVELLRQYYFVGGMPEVVAEFVNSRTSKAVRKIQLDILAAYDADIAKHAGRETQKARMVFQSIPAQLAKENKKFVFGALKKGARAAEYENAIQWLVDAGLVYKVPRLSKVDLPLKFYMDKDAFKLFVLDVGLLGAMAQIPSSLMLIGNSVFSDYKGAFAENYVLTQMISVPETVLGYYSKDNSTMELDFIVQVGSHLLPVEVKAEENVKSKSLRQFITVDKADSGLCGIRFSMKGYISQDWMKNVPLFAVHPFVMGILLSNT